jgi:hypothetical protein
MSKEHITNENSEIDFDCYLPATKIHLGTTNTLTWPSINLCENPHKWEETSDLHEQRRYQLSHCCY